MWFKRSFSTFLLPSNDGRNNANKCREPKAGANKTLVKQNKALPKGAIALRIASKAEQRTNSQ